MIEPEEIDGMHVYTGDRDQQMEIEQTFDVAIRLAARTGAWPATVPSYRSGWTKIDVEAVAQKYREAGWEVDTSSPTWTAVLTRPTSR